MLLELCAEKGLIITNSMFQQKARFKTPWRHSSSKHWHLLDYVLMRQKDRRDMLDTGVMPTADCNTDHRLVWTKVGLKIKPVRKRGA